LCRRTGDIDHGFRRDEESLYYDYALGGGAGRWMGRDRVRIGEQPNKIEQKVAENVRRIVVDV
jgi:hypothetical protein